MNIDACTKFITEKTVWQQFCERYDYGEEPREIFEEFNSSNIDNPRKVVIASHNSISYQVDGMTDEYNPWTYKFKLRDGTMVSMAEYFDKQYNIQLKHEKQPLLFVNRRMGDRIYLPTELCQEASLPKNFTRNQRDQQTLQDVKLNSAQKRFELINRLIQKFQNDETFQQWGVTVDNSNQEIQGKKLEQPQVFIRNNIVRFNDINRNQLTTPLTL